VTKLTRTTEQQGEAPPKLTEQQTLKSLVYPIKVIVSPFKAFKEIAQNPDIKGLVLIVGLVLLATVGAYYAQSSKVFILINDTSTSLLASNTFANNILPILTQTALLFIMNWVIYAGVLLLVLRAFREKGGSWRPFFVLIGYAFSILIMQAAVSALLIATLPEIHFSNLSTWPPTTQDEVTMANDKIQETWGSIPAFQALTYLTFPYINFIDIWLVMLSVVAVRAFTEITWTKAVMISTTAFLLRFFLRFFLGL